MEQDQKFLEYVVTSLADHPEDVQITRTVDEMGVLLTLKLHKEDMGKIIGRSGATAKAIRTVLRVVGMKNDARVNLKIEEPEGMQLPPEAEDTTEVTEKDRPKPQSKTLDDVLGSL